MVPVRGALTALLGVLALSGCGPVDDGTTGDCNARLRIGTTIYRAHASPLPSPSGPYEQVTPIGAEAEVVDCDGAAIDTVLPVELEGVPTSVAVAVPATGDWPGVYVAEGADLPEPPR